MTELTAVRLSKELSEEIHEWRRAQPDLPSKGEAIRRLLQDALSLHKRGATGETKKRKG